MARAGSVSIHAPRAGGDTRNNKAESPTLSFNPRPPRGGRQYDRVTKAFKVTFQSTPPARGATNR